MRTLAIDLGSRRVGLALSDAGGCLATPLQVLQVNSAEAALQPVLGIIAEQGVERIVVGLPINMDGTNSSAAQAATRWARTLQQRSSLPVFLADERLTSFDADQTLSARRRAGERLTHKKKQQRRDALAAAALLQDFLDGRIAGAAISD
jgi:putative Holliday junction resolvase